MKTKPSAGSGKDPDPNSLPVVPFLLEFCLLEGEVETHERLKKEDGLSGSFPHEIMKGLVVIS